MKIAGTLMETMRELEDKARHDGYWYSISEVLTIMVCGMLCHLQTKDDIHEWSQAGHARKALFNDTIKINSG